MQGGRGKTHNFANCSFILVILLTVGVPDRISGGAPPVPLGNPRPSSAPSTIVYALH